MSSADRRSKVKGQRSKVRGKVLGQRYEGSGTKYEGAGTRREFLQTAATTAATLLTSGLPSGWVGGIYADDGPETKTIRFGIIALTDCAPIVMAHELGYFKKFGIESVISKEASWAVIRDKLSLGENQATHMLIGMPLASTMGLAGSPVKP